MKNIIILLAAFMITLNVSAQTDPISLSWQQRFLQVTLPAYSTGGFKALVKNTTTGRMETAMPALSSILDGSFTAANGSQYQNFNGTSQNWIGMNYFSLKTAAGHRAFECGSNDSVTYDAAFTYNDGNGEWNDVEVFVHDRQDVWTFFNYYYGYVDTLGYSQIQLVTNDEAIYINTSPSNNYISIGASNSLTITEETRNAAFVADSVTLNNRPLLPAITLDLQADGTGTDSVFVFDLPPGYTQSIVQSKDISYGISSHVCPVGSGCAMSIHVDQLFVTINNPIPLSGTANINLTAFIH